ncbi:MAG: site-specific integrase [Anaerolineae bacterium]|nr:site-specific integrase [Anaerolineae bacterium]
MAAVIDYTNPAREAALKSLSFLKPRARRDDERKGRALRAWDGSSLLGARNRALLGVMFCCGLRQAELAALTWDDVDLEQSIIRVRHGKGDKSRHVPSYGDFTPAALRAWRSLAGKDRQYVFPRMFAGDVIGDDAPITTDGVFHVIQETIKRTGDPFSPHDARRTFTTEALATGHTLADVQADADHKRPDTTLDYAQPSQAVERRQRGRLRYG